MPFPRFLAACFLLLLFGETMALSLAGQEAGPPNSNDPRVAILKRFVDECVLVTPGTDPFPRSFVFGSVEGSNNTAPAREVTLDRTFRMSRYEVTQELYEIIAGDNPSRWKGKRNSAESMTYAEAVRFCRVLTVILRREQLIGEKEVVRLPTEIEWEYCCRAGTKTRYSFGDDAKTADEPDPGAGILDAYAWHTGNAAGNDPAVGILKPNPWGLCDCHGYLWEFTADEWTETGVASTGAENAASDSSAAMRTVRGGSWKDDSSRLTSTSRQPVAASASDDAIGFRCLIAEKPQALTH
ncbi:MAG: formylglycine-generating enzyme family protein [Planctomycetaceae bacterium]|nr:formylglycine-generating enzyme family protein [Planctomycetaceae bacterium]